MIFIKVLHCLTEDESDQSLVNSIYYPWSILHLFMRVILVSIACGRVNSNAHGFRKSLQKCPASCYTTDVSRWNRRLCHGPMIGLTGLNCFTVTKPFILKMLSVIVTFEIVLLQCVPSPHI